MTLGPSIFLSVEELQRARQRTTELRWAEKRMQQLLADAEEAIHVPLPDFEWAWWDRAKAEGTSPWDLYPPVTEQTRYIPADILIAARTLARAYLFEQDERFSRRVRQILLHFEETMRLDVVHWDIGMNYGDLAMRLLEAYEYCFDAFCQDEQAKLQEWFMQLRDAVYDNDQLWIEKIPGGPLNNHYTHHKQSILTIDLFFGLEPSMEYALESPMGIRDQMEQAVLDNGLWIENSLSYHLAPANMMVSLAEVLRRGDASIDLYEMQFGNGACLRSLLDGIITLAWPDLRLPHIGDAYGHPVYLCRGNMWMRAWVAYHDPVYGWLASQREERTVDDVLWSEEVTAVERPPVKSRSFREHGYAFLTTKSGREYWGSDATALFVSFDRSGTHGHLDTLSLQMFSHGQVIAADAEAVVTKYGVAAPVHKELNTRTISHNTILVDGGSQRGPAQPLDVLWHRELGEVQTVIAEDANGRLYEGVWQRRAIALTREYVLDVFFVNSDVEHQYDWLFHADRDASPFDIDSRFGPASLEDVDGGHWLSDVTSAMIDGEWSAEWEIHDTQARLTMVGDPGTEVFLCEYPGADEAGHSARPMLLARRTGCSTCFVAIYQASRGKPDPVTATLEPDGDQMRVTIETEGVEREHVFPTWD